jgi:hypothetical protein
LQVVDHIEPIDVGQAEVEKDQVRRRIDRKCQRVRPGERGADLIAAIVEVDGEHAHDRWFVVDDEHMVHD